MEERRDAPVLLLASAGGSGGGVDGRRCSIDSGVGEGGWLYADGLHGRARSSETVEEVPMIAAESSKLAATGALSRTSESRTRPAASGGECGG